MQMVAGVEKGKAQLEEGRARDMAKRYEARQLVTKSKAEQAKGQREAIEQRRKGEIFLSDAIAAAAAGGGVTTDAAAIEDIAKVNQAIDYNALSALYDAELEAQTLRQQAKSRVWEGKLARKASYRAAHSTMMDTAADAMGSMGGGMGGGGGG